MYNNQFDFDNSAEQQVIYESTAFGALMRKVYVWMTLALVVSGLTAFYVATTPSIVQLLFSSRIGIFGLFIAEMALVIFLTARIHKMQFATAGLLFVLYSILNGVTLSTVFMVYTMSSIASTFFITAGTFGAMSIIGYKTNSDLSKMGNYLLYALVGLIIATVVNIFVASSGLDWIISYLGVIIFIGLTAYDTQKIKQMFLMNGYEVNDSTQKLALIGSLSLYLDFVNLFLYLLRIVGDRR